MPNLLFSIIDALSDGKFHSGEVLAKQFEVSRASIWNAIADWADLYCGLFYRRIDRWSGFWQPC